MIRFSGLRGQINVWFGWLRMFILAWGENSAKEVPVLGMDIDLKLGNVYIVPMNVISRKKLKAFWEVHTDSEEQLKAWHADLRKNDYQSFVGLKKTYASADYVGNDRYVFDIKGNTYRIVAMIDFNAKIVLIRFVGTHDEYDRIDAASI